MNIAIVDYEAGNLRSVETAFNHIGAQFRVVQIAEELLEADRLVVPGVGDARAAMATLRSRGLDEAIREFHRSRRPILGICLGAQIVLDRSEENSAECLGLISGSTVAFDSTMGLKIPHMGWNTVDFTTDHPLFEGILEQSSFYFVHSYVPQPAEPDAVLAECDYGNRFAAVVGRDNLVATQFHPEKSGELGLRMLRNFLRWQPAVRPAG